MGLIRHCSCRWPHQCRDVQLALPALSLHHLCCGETRKQSSADQQPALSSCRGPAGGPDLAACTGSRHCTHVSANSSSHYSSPCICPHSSVCIPGDGHHLCTCPHSSACTPSYGHNPAPAPTAVCAHLAMATTSVPAPTAVCVHRLWPQHLPALVPSRRTWRCH